MLPEQEAPGVPATAGGPPSQQLVVEVRCLKCTLRMSVFLIKCQMAPTSNTIKEGGVICKANNNQETATIAYQTWYRAAERYVWHQHIWVVRGDSDACWVCQEDISAGPVSSTTPAPLQHHATDARPLCRLTAHHAMRAWRTRTWRIHGGLQQTLTEEVYHHNCSSPQHSSTTNPRSVSLAVIDGVTHGQQGTESIHNNKQQHFSWLCNLLVQQHGILCS
jgi:hypothetical protein